MESERKRYRGREEESYRTREREIESLNHEFLYVSNILIVRVKYDLFAIGTW